MRERLTSLRACVFDFDGVVVDSEPLHAEAKRGTLGHFRIAYPADIFDRFKGRPDADFFAYVAEALAPEESAHALQTDKDARYAELFGRVELIAGVAELVAAARRAYGRVGLATSATRRDFGLAADRYGLRSWFDVVVTGEDTPRHKPDPAPYLRATELLGVPPAATVAIEDSPNGVRSAKAAGCVVAGLAAEFGAELLASSGADLVAPSLPELARALGLSGTPRDWPGRSARNQCSTGVAGKRS